MKFWVFIDNGIFCTIRITCDRIQECNIEVTKMKSAIAIIVIFNIIVNIFLFVIVDVFFNVIFITT